MGVRPFPSPQWFRSVVERVISRATEELALDIPWEHRDEVDLEVIGDIEALKKYICVELEERRESSREGRLQRNVLRRQLWGDPLSVVAIGLDESFWSRYAAAKAALYRSRRGASYGGSSDAEVRVPTPGTEARGAMQSTPSKVELSDYVNQDVQEGRPTHRQQSQCSVQGPSWSHPGRASVDMPAPISAHGSDCLDPLTSKIDPNHRESGLKPSVKEDWAFGKAAQKTISDNLTEASLEKIRKAVKAAKQPPGAPIRVGAAETLSSFRVFYRNQAMINGWSIVHEFYWLSHNIETKLWLQICGVRPNLLPNPLSRACYGQAVKFLWASLDRRFGRDKEVEQLQAESLTLTQRPSEKLLAYLGRISDHRSRSHYASLVRKDSEWIAAARSGIRDPLMRRLSYLPVDPQLLKDSDGLESAPIGEWEAWLISMEKLTINESESVEAFAGQTVDQPAGGSAVSKGGGSRRGRRSPFRGKCFGCQKFGHRVAECPEKGKGSTRPDSRKEETDSAVPAVAKPQEAAAVEAAQDGGKQEADDCEVHTSAYAIECSWAEGCQEASPRRSWAIAESDNPPILQLKFGELYREGLIDTGSATSLVDQSTADSLCQLGHAAWVRSRMRVVVKYADSREETAKGEVILRAVVNGSTCYFPCLVVGRLGRPIIVGRRGLRLLGLELKFRQDDENERSSLRDAFEEACGTVHAAGDQADCGQVDIETAIECYNTNGELYVADLPTMDEPVPDQHYVKDVVDRKVRPALNRALSTEVVKEEDAERLVSSLLGEVSRIAELPVAAGYTLRLQRLETDDPEPAEDGQEYRFVASWQVKEPETKEGVWNSAGLIHKLGEKEREEFLKNCDYYVSKGYWKEKGLDDIRFRSSPTGSPLTGVIFPVKQDPAKTTAIRPVCDLRGINEVSPRISNAQLTTSDAVMNLRANLRSGYMVAQYDLSKAFYSVEVAITDRLGERVPLELSVGGVVYQTRRLAFGLSCGPLMLNSTQRIDLMVVEAAYDALYGQDSVNPAPKVVVVMDDFLLTGTEVAIQRFERLLLCCWQKTGFCCPVDKRARWGTTVPVRWLGGYWFWDSANGELSLTRPEVTFKKQFSDRNSAENLSKRLVFKHGGQFIGISCGVSEALARSHADCARVLASRSDCWDKTGGDWTAEAWLHLSLACRYWEHARENEDRCLPLFSKVTDFRAEIDASGVGFGYVWKDNSTGQVLACAARIQSRSMFIASWHVNRRELYAIAWCLQRLEDCLIFFPAIRSLKLLSDSVVAVRQSDVWTVPWCKSVERKAILRLRGVICDAVHGMAVRKPPVEVTTGHVEGSMNKIADALSRTAVTKKFLEVPLWSASADEEVQVVDCHYAVVHSWLHDGSSGALALPSYRSWLMLRKAFRGWGGRDTVGDEDAPSAQWMILRQSEDAFCQSILDQADDDGYVT
ncbi:hypothetical protein Pmar_PMAR028478 [Perkinsus marinus ATCC 50983]|uniref:CCHC-type domain-containing protein n=1 Tax=Perkinsus marinus (strain ATCC 50983 / TXsc) TaxID=423536 RepID=C5LM87_PERM5|nr:hypothetical protein Pmar_PMAR028478 [Perkinsus marinus ATCC 50983]EER02099.1 hypothetical protein Pmar_PMAR028478 [Perkinsus marinus ATCC 50983]|eukprot:XP_002769381.1 hypothetical protein Pmar_PMAR028478 [Perkinsus marinus ATCC 50983]